MRIPARLMPHRVTVEGPPVQTPTGTKPGSIVSGVRAYVEDVETVIAGANGSTVVSGTSVWLDPEIATDAAGHITLPAEFASKRPPRRKVLRVDRYRHPHAPSHNVARLE